ncbi:MAG: RdgB/HAM1 family non-canonical purine NTP pyrophosphatase [Bacteroidales bacterium]|nr:RdgB/HAM1 family non-canonical purine NTP pyrophosphatase [Bacteroidales bacterium]
MAIQIIFATGNKGKLREAGEILGEDYALISPRDLGIDEDIPETGTTLKANSLQKAQYLFDRTGKNCFADDTGLEVDALDGAPGVYTARYAGGEKGHDFNANMDKLLSELAKKPGCDRSARFVSVVTLFLDGKTYFFEGEMKGKIAMSKAGCGGFGYDPVFIADEYPDRTVAEITEEQKNEISHRGKALRAMAEFLKNRK